MLTKRKIGIVVVLAVISIILGLTIFYQNPIRKTKLYLELREYRQAVDLYNRTNYRQSDQNEIDTIIQVILEDTKDPGQMERCRSVRLKQLLKCLKQLTIRL